MQVVIKLNGKCDVESNQLGIMLSVYLLTISVHVQESSSRFKFVCFLDFEGCYILMVKKAQN